MKIGIFGGTFNPPHIGHINACKCFNEYFDFDKLYVIPVYSPPHKDLKTFVTAQNRLEMSKIAFEGLSDNIIVSDLEIKRKGRSYTADTIQHFKELGYDDIYFLCGTDMILTLGTWYKPEYIFDNATIVYMRRENDSDIEKLLLERIEEYKTKFGAKIEHIDAESIQISSTDIRESVKNGAIESKFLTPELLKYIIENNLYRNEQK